MLTRDRTLIEEIERDVLDSKTSLADALRKCIVLGGKVGSADLREWASRELQGYGNDVELPEYRKPVATIHVEAITGSAFTATYKVTERIDPTFLPDFVAEQVGEEVPLGQGIGEIEALLEQARLRGGNVHMSLPMGAAITQYMNAEHADAGIRGQHIGALYWSLSESAIRGVLERVRTTLAELVAEMRAAMPDADETPTADVADQAVHVAVHGSRPRVVVNNAQATRGGSHDVRVGVAADSAAWSWWRIGGGVVGVATIIGTVAAVGAWQGWGI